ncbi:hypothetical protein GJAV_G00187610 [Gymnothorax javanicus]|nr:hypothetical protein GJAV_G00187610 [Gymnothorax javanicus]
MPKKSVEIYCSAAEDNCSNECRGHFNASSLWYVWAIIAFISILLGCGCIASCIKMFCRPHKPPVPILGARPLEVTVISMDNQSTILGINQGFSDTHPPNPFTPAADNSLSPPPYDVCALDSLPKYDEALAMPMNDIGGNTEDCGELHPMPLSAEELTEFPQDSQLGERGLQVVQDPAAFDGEEPPAYQPYSAISEEEFNEIDLDEHVPSENQK